VNLKTLSQLPNIGNVLSEKLRQIEITTPEKLLQTGTEQTFIRLMTVDKSACLSELLALEGAIQGIRWHNLPKERKEELKVFFRMRSI